MGKVKLPAPWISTASEAYAVLKMEAERNRIIGNTKEAERCDERASTIERKFLIRRKWR